MNRIEHLYDEIEPFCTPAAPSPCDGLIPRMLARHTWPTPTLVALRAKGSAVDSATLSDTLLQYIPTALRTDWLKERRQKLDRGAAYVNGKQSRYGDEVWLVRRLHAAGVPLLAGSDAGVAFCFPGFGLHDELRLLTSAGLSNLEAIRSATLDAARFLNATDSLGSIAVGKCADLVLLRRNLLADIRATADIEAVVLCGRLFRRQALGTLLLTAAAAARR